MTCYIALSFTVVARDEALVTGGGMTLDAGEDREIGALGKIGEKVESVGWEIPKNEHRTSNIERSTLKRVNR
jgi:hypothetical protein